MIDRRRQSSILDVRSFTGVDCDTDHYLIGSIFRGRLAVSKLTAKKFNGERFNLRELKDLEVKKQYQIEITNRFTALGNITDDDDINWEWENIKTSAKQSLGLHEMKQHKPWFHEECLQSLDERKQAKLQMGIRSNSKEYR